MRYRRAIVVTILTVLMISLACRTVRRGGPSWAQRIDLKASDVRYKLGVPFNEGQSAWYWSMRLLWEGQSPLEAQLRLADLYKLPDTPSDLLLRFDVPRSPTEVTVHVVPIEDKIPQAERVVVVVTHGEQVITKTIVNPFRGATGGSPTPGSIALDDPGIAQGNHAELQLLDVHFEDRNRKLSLFIDLRQDSGRMPDLSIPSLSARRTE